MDDQRKTPLDILLKQLDADENAASEKYLTLQLKLTKKMIWNGCPEYEAEALADRVIDLVAKKISEIEEKLAQGIAEENGKEIKRIESIPSYALEVARLIGLEHYRKHQSKRVDGEELPEVVVNAEDFQADSDDRMDCLRKCILKIPEQADRQFILGYYDTQENEKNKEAREKLRIKFGLTVSNFKKKACVLRQRLEKCINDCLPK